MRVYRIAYKANNKERRMFTNIGHIKTSRRNWETDTSYQVKAYEMVEVVGVVDLKDMDKLKENKSLYVGITIPDDIVKSLRVTNSDDQIKSIYKEFLSRVSQETDFEGWIQSLKNN